MSDEITGTSRYSIAATIVFGTWVLLGQAAGASAQPLGRQQETDRAAYCRTPENDAVNCLYLQLRLLGYAESYEDFRKQLPDDPRSWSLQSLANQGRKLGFRLVPVKLTVSELAKAGAPVIVHFEEEGIGSGRFHLLLWMDNTWVALIDGSYVTHAEMSRDQFRRNWTGYALIAHPPTPWSLWVRRGAAVLVLASAGIWLARQTRILSWLAFFVAPKRLFQPG
jgi:Peptidase C39 family